MILTIDYDRFLDLDDLIDESGKAVRIAIPRALNRSISGVQTQINKRVRELYNVPRGDVRAAQSLRKANSKHWYSEIVIKGSKISLHRFSPIPRNPGGKLPETGASALISRSVGRIKYAGSFYAVMPSRGAGLYKRMGTERNKVKKLMGPSLPDMLKNTAIVEEAENQASDYFYKAFRHELDTGFKYTGRF